MSKLNYSKWDNLELSDDSDIEVHPNVDKRSFIRWKQRDIHDKRAERKDQLDQLRAEASTNATLVPMLDALLKGVRDEGSSFYSREVSRLSAGRAGRGNKDGPDGPTSEDMVLSLLLQINEQPSVKGKSAPSVELDEALAQALEEHVSKLKARQAEVQKSISEMEAEEKRKITSDSIREGWSSGHVTKSEPAPPEPAPKPKKTTKSKSQRIETLNAPSSSTAPAGLSPGSDAEDSDAEDVPALTPAMRSFAALPPATPSLPPSATALPAKFHPARDLKSEAFDAALKFLGSNSSLLRESAGTTDALLVEAFNAQMRGESDWARKCTEKALMVQYCNKLGRDGVALFFKRMVQADGKAAAVFLNDVLSTYSRIFTRSAALASEQASSGPGTEQIQLVAEDPSTTITFEVPDGPPPEKIELEGEGSENMDPERVKEFLQRRWDIFMGFEENLREALKTKSLEKVNAVLGNMEVGRAEKVVGLLDEAGILSFSSSEVRDETGK